LFPDHSCIVGNPEITLQLTHPMPPDDGQMRPKFWSCAESSDHAQPSELSGNASVAAKTEVRPLAAHLKSPSDAYRRTKANFEKGQRKNSYL
jgi:hypothetical protein